MKQIIARFCHSERSRGISYCFRNIQRCDSHSSPSLSLRPSRLFRGFPSRFSTPLDMTADNADVVSCLRLRFDRDFGLHRISNKTLLVRGMIHLFQLLLGRLFFAGELQSLI